MKAFLEKKINWIVVFMTLILFAFFISIVLPKVYIYTEKVVGGSGSPDTSFFYSGRDLYEIAESYGQEGRSNYLKLRWTFDVVWPLVYLIFLLSACIQLAKPLTSKWLNNLYYLPIIATGFDYLENTLASIFMITFPAKLYWLGTMTSLASSLKWFWLSLAFAAVFLLAIVRVIRIFTN